MNSATLNGSPALSANYQELAKPRPQLAEAAPPSSAPTNAPARKSRRFPARQAALAVLALAVGIGAVKLATDWWNVGRFIETTDDAYVGGDVTVIAPKVPGFIAQLAVEDNQPVHAGDLLLKLDDRDYQAALARTEAAVANQQATLSNLDALRSLQEAVVAQAKDQVVSADAEIVRARDDRKRYHNLVGNGVVSVQNDEQAETTYQQDLAAGDKDRAAETAAERQLSVIDTQKLQTRAALAGAIADRDLARLNVGYTELRAPIDGIVGNRSAQIGAYATAGSQLISLIPAHGLWIDANFKEDQLAHMHAGSPATVTVDSIPGRAFHGRVVSIAPATGAEFSVLPPENATGNFTKIVQRVTVRIALDDEAAALGQLRPGLSVTAKVDTHSNAQTGL